MIFTCSMVPLGALQKERSLAKDSLRLGRVGALVRGYFGWAPSKVNLADGPLRDLVFGSAGETIRQHVQRGIPKRLEQLFRERLERGGAGH